MPDNNTRLFFNPLRGLENEEIIENQSVPTTASDYLNEPAVKPLSIEWNPVQLEKANNFVNWAVNTSQEEKDKELDVMRDINRWDAGVDGLNDNEKTAWKYENFNKIRGKSDEWIDRLWRNQQYIAKYGLDDFKSTPVKERDKKFEDGITGEAIIKIYGNDDNVSQLLELTPQGRRELLNSDYKPSYALRQADIDAQEKNWSDYTWKERINAQQARINELGLRGLGIGSIAGTTVAGGIGSIAGAAIGGALGYVTGFWSGLAHPEYGDDLNVVQRRKDNEDILNKITVADNERKKEESKNDIDELSKYYLKAYSNKQISDDEVDDMFNAIALSGKKTATDELGNTEQYDYQGSQYYTAFRNSDEFAHFDTYDKIRHIAQAQVLGQKYGQNSALQILDQDMQSYVSDNQTGWTWTGNTLKNVWVGGLSNLGMKYVALGALAARIAYGEEGLANYLNGKDASGNGEDNWLINNPSYWNKVDQYNDLGIDMSWLDSDWSNHFKEAEENGGLSTSTNVTKPGTESDFWSWNTLNEAVKMNKFAWSDLMVNLGLGKLVRGATRLAGGVELAPGVLATESTALSKFINQAGSFGVLNASSLGIDAAYGMQTYEETLRKNNERLDKIIDKDIDIEVQKRLHNPRSLQEFKSYVNTENERRQTSAGERGKWIPVDEEKAWGDYIKHIENQIRQEQEALHAEDRVQAEKDAANAYMIDASIEHLRMATTNGVFKSYLFDKGTLNALRLNNPYVATTTTKEGMYALGKHATGRKTAQILGMNVWGGFHSNYFDDVTVGFAEGFGIQDYNNYLLQKYNPAAYGSVMDDYVNPFVAGMSGAENAMTEKRSLLDGTIGALGSVFTFMPNPVGMITHKQRMKEAAEAAEKAGKKKNDLSWQEIASDFVNNPILQAYADAKSATRLTEAEIKRRNDLMKENAYAFDNMVPTLSALNQKATTREGMSIMEAEDAKDKEAFTLASNLLSMKNSGVVVNAQAEPDKANWSKKKKAADVLNRIFNAILGTNAYDQAESSYTRAMQTLNDAATIGEASDEATIQRQQELIETFLGLDENQNVLREMSREDQVILAQDRLKKNASNMLNVMRQTEQLQKQFEKSLQANLHPDVQQQLLYQYVLDGRWKIRLADLEEMISGEREHELVRGDANIIAKYGSTTGYERIKDAQEKVVKQAQDALYKADIETQKKNDPTKSIAENARIKATREANKKIQAERLKREQEKLAKIKEEGTLLQKLTEAGADVIEAEDILKMDADGRYRMLDDFYRNDYSAAQQVEIDRAKSLLIQDGTSLNEAMERVRDAAILTHRIEDNMEVAKRIMQNPMEANLMQQALVNNRRKAIIDYFNDKIVAEAFNDFVNDSESTISQENVVKKARNFSTSVLNGMLREIEKETARERTSEELSDKTLSNLEDGIKTVLNERDGRLKETADLDRFIKKTKKVKHTDTIPASETVNVETGEITWVMEQQITTDRELSLNDKKLLNYALDYAAERGLSLDELTNKVGTEDFERYIQERNHAYQLTANPYTGETVETNVGTAENRANPVSPEYMRGLFNDVRKAFQTNKEAIDKVAASKPIAEKPESVATKPVEPIKANPNVKDEEIRPDEVDPNDPLGLKKKTAEAAKPAETPATITKEEKGNTNAEIMDSASILNQGILEDLNILLEELDKMKMDDNTRNKIREIISANLASRTFSNIKELQNRVLEEALITNQTDAPQITARANALMALDIKGIKERKQTKEVPPVNTTPAKATTFAPAPKPAILETRDLDAMMNYPVFADYIKQHNIIGFLQRLTDLWNKEMEVWRSSGKQGTIHQSQVVFIYDPSLAEGVKNSIEQSGGFYNPEISAPVMMAIEITDANKALVDDNSQLVTIQDKADNKVKQYQVVGFMPASEVSTSSSDVIKATADRMGALRNRINYSDAEPHVLRYAPANDTGKYNGTVIKTNIEKVSSHTEEDRIPHATEETPRTNVQQLMDENSQSATESFVNATDEEVQIYNEAKEKADRNAIRKTSLYKKLRKAFIDRLRKRERTSSNSDEANTKELNFNLQKGTSDTYPKIVLVKKISETLDKNTGRPIADLLNDVDDLGSNAQEVIESNSRFKRLFNQLTKLRLGSGFFNSEGNIVNKALYDKALADFANSVKNTIENNLHVDDISVKVEMSNGVPSEKIVYVKVYSGDMNNTDNLLSVLSFGYGGQLSQAEYASFLKDLILENGNPRPGLNDSRFERVKWQVNYEDANTANDATKTAAERKAARDNLEDLYDDGIFEMQVTKLAYPSRSVTVSINPIMKSRLYTQTRAEAEAPKPEPTESKAVHEVETANGKVDADTGMRTEAPTKESILKGIPRLIINTIQKILKDSKDRNLTDDKKNYSIEGQLWSRVTSIKSAMEGMGERFNPENAWALPSTKIGDSLDTFGRDVFNGVFDSMTDQERKEAFETYDNSTEKNYAEVYMALKAFEARLRSKGQTVIATGTTREDAGHITAKGVLDVAVRGDNGVRTKKVRVAGTLDVLAVDSDGNLHIYDFKTHRSSNFSRTEAEKKGYDRQLSMYAKFLEDEYGLKVKSINIIPVKANYPTPSGRDNNGNIITNAQKSYKESRPNSNQLLVKDVTADDSKYEQFDGANFQVENEFSLTRLNDADLTASFERMSADEKANIIDAIQDQSETPSEEATKTDDIIEAKPEIVEDDINEEEEEGLSLRGKKLGLGRKLSTKAKVDTSTEGTTEAINPNDEGGLLARIKELKNACGGKKA